MHTRRAKRTRMGEVVRPVALMRTICNRFPAAYRTRAGFENKGARKLSMVARLYSDPVFDTCAMLGTLLSSRQLAPGQ